MITMTDPPNPRDYYHDSVRMKFEHGKTTWRCLVCDEDVTHQHKPKKPSYEALVTELRLLEEQIAKHYQGVYPQLPPSVSRDVWVDLRNLLQRVDNGR